MAAKYDFKTSPDIQGEKEQPTLYPQIVVSGTKNLKDLAKDIARRLNPEKPDVPLNKNDAFQKVQKRRVQEKR